jgi:hypothetical protein
MGDFQRLRVSARPRRKRRASHESLGVTLLDHLVITHSERECTGKADWTRGPAPGIVIHVICYSGNGGQNATLHDPCAVCRRDGDGDNGKFVMG